jgi:hypothetical protein
MFFSKFPLTTALLNERTVVITDFFRRVVASTSFAGYQTYLMPENVLDGETPDLMAYRFYGNPQYHWVLLIINNIVDPYQEWPLASKNVAPLVYEKYDFSIHSPTVIEDGDVVKGDTVYAITDGVSSKTTVSAIVRHNSSTASHVFLRSKAGKFHITTGTTLVNDRNDVELTVTSVKDPEERPHHYEDAGGNWVEYDADLLAQETITLVSNLEYETAVNDDKRIKYVLDPEFLPQFVREFERALNN